VQGEGRSKGCFISAQRADRSQPGDRRVRDLLVFLRMQTVRDREVVRKDEEVQSMGSARKLDEFDGRLGSLHNVRAGRAPLLRPSSVQRRRFALSMPNLFVELARRVLSASCAVDLPRFESDRARRRD
jgi:hypothetical protein